MRTVSRKLGHKRQVFYKERKQRAKKSREDAKVIANVTEIRNTHPRAGVEKLLEYLSKGDGGEKLTVGRDYLYTLLRKNNMLIEPRKKEPKTTDSMHEYVISPNLLEGLELTHPYQALVSDITYIPCNDGFLYLSLVTDAYSREILGYHLHDSLKTEGCIEALKMAIKNIPSDKHPLHHSDRGVQYASHEYRKWLANVGYESSMTAERHCYENAKAERVNGILKDEYYLDVNFPTREMAEKEVARVIKIYNTKRVHESLGMLTPVEFRKLRSA